MSTHYYGYLLGEQTAFEHSTHADKFVYETELRTGMGTHLRYAEHLHAAYNEFVKRLPEVDPYVQLGSAEPEYRIKSTFKEVSRRFSHNRFQNSGIYAPEK